MRDIMTRYVSSGAGPIVGLAEQSGFVQPLTGRVAIAEMPLLVTDNLILFVSFARDQHTVARSRQTKGPANCFAAIIGGKARCRTTKAGKILFDNLLRIFRSRVVAGN